jgi:hypothetical protein
MIFKTLLCFVCLTGFCDSASFYFNYNSTLKPVYDEDTKNEQLYNNNNE